MIKKLQQVKLKCSSIEEMKYQYSINYSDKFNLIGYRLKKIEEGYYMAVLTLSERRGKK